jgi:hypothetical protein
MQSDDCKYPIDVRSREEVRYADRGIIGRGPFWLAIETGTKEMGRSILQNGGLASAVTPEENVAAPFCCKGQI